MMFCLKKDISKYLIIVVVMLLVSLLSTTAYAVEPDLPKEDNLSITPTPQPFEQPSIDNIYLPWLNKDNMESSVSQPIKPNQASLTLNGYEIHTLTLRIQQSSDDAWYHEDDGYQHTRTNDPIGGAEPTTLYLGTMMAWRFTDVTIPPGATILSATLSLVKHGDHWGVWNFEWLGEDSDNAVTFSPDNTPGDRKIQSFYEGWDEIKHSDDVNHLDGVRYSFENLATIVQRVVYRPKWRPGNALVIIAANSSRNWDRKWWRTFDYDNDPNGPNVPELVIRYKVPIIPSNVILVDNTATGANDGSSWADAYTNLQTALAAATAGDEIWVATGVYTPGNSRHDSFSLKSGVAIYGGFAGYESRRMRRDYDTGSILSGDIGGDDITNSQGIVTNTNNIMGENSYHVINNEDVSSTAILDGFVITGGNANGTSNNADGGGMRNQNSSPILTDLTFVGNSANVGGGIYNSEGSPTLTNLTFIGNSANVGGGMYNSEGSPTLTDLTFIGNSADYGGGISSNGGTPTLTNLTFIENYADYGGGMDCYGLYDITLVNVAFIKNYAEHEGGGMHKYYCPAILTDITFIENSVNSEDTGRGGGLYNSGATLRMTNATFTGNSANLGGGIYNEDSRVRLENATLIGNSANLGGGIYNHIWYYIPYSPPYTVSLTDVKIWGNIATSGGQIYNEDYGSKVTDIQDSLIGGSGGSGLGWDIGLGDDSRHNFDPLFTTDFYPE